MKAAWRLLLISLCGSKAKTETRPLLENPGGAGRFLISLPGWSLVICQSHQAVGEVVRLLLMFYSANVVLTVIDHSNNDDNNETIKLPMFFVI